MADSGSGGTEAGRDQDTTFAQLLVRLRKSARLTQEELASASGISARTISDMERGRVNAPQRRTVQALAAALTLDGADRWEFLRSADTGRARIPTPRPPAAAPLGAALGGGDQHLTCELPPEVADLTGREDEAARVLALIESGARTGRRAATVVSLFGTPGVGKTAFAVHLGHRLADRYPDGCAFLDLRGMKANQLTPGQALGRLLLALGVPEARIPASTDERCNLHRALLRDRKMLLILDDAADEAQVRPVLPASPGCLVLITSRRVLSGLESVNRVLLDVLSPPAAVRLLASITGEQLVDAEPAAAGQVAELCGYLPLALRIAGNRLASRPRWPVANLVHQLSDRQHRLSALTAGDLQVRAAFDVSYQQCDDRTRAVFRWLSMVAGPDVTAELAAVLAETDEPTVVRCLEELVDASLLDTTPVDGRYMLHDLIRVFAGERLGAEESPDRIRLAEHRLTASILATGTHAGLLLSGSGSGPDSGSPSAGSTPADAVRWLDAEQAHWLAALRHAARVGLHAEVLAFSRAMHWYSDLRPASDLWLEVFTYGVKAAGALGRQADEAMQLNFLGWALNRIHGLHQEALRTHRRALQAARAAGDRKEEAWALQYCARAELDQGRPAAAAELFRPAISLFAELGDRMGQHIALSFLGVALHELGRYDAAAQAHRTAVTHFRQVDTISYRNVLALGLLRLADTLEAAGDPAAADAGYREAGAVAIGVNSHLVEGMAWFGCGRCRHRLGDRASAARHLDIALTIFTDTGERWLQARVLDQLATVADHDDKTQARRYRQRALDICRHLGTTQARQLADTLTAALSPT